MPIKVLADVAAAQCPARDVLARLSDRWSVLVLVALRAEARRFTSLKRDIGDISPRMLAQTLRHLEQDGLVERTVYPTIPPRVDYALTPLGRSLLAQVEGLVAWADEHHAAIREARVQYVSSPVATAVGA